MVVAAALVVIIVVVCNATNVFSFSNSKVFYTSSLANTYPSCVLEALLQVR